MNSKNYDFIGFYSNLEPLWLSFRNGGSTSPTLQYFQSMVQSRAMHLSIWSQSDFMEGGLSWKWNHYKSDCNNSISFKDNDKILIASPILKQYTQHQDHCKEYKAIARTSCLTKGSLFCHKLHLLYTGYYFHFTFSYLPWFFWMLYN